LHLAPIGSTPIGAQERHMRIAQVSPLYESVPPQLYGGTERVVAYLTNELVRQGHDVTLFASGDSYSSAELVPICSRALRLDSGPSDDVAWHLTMIERVARRADEFDLIHFHLAHLHYPLSSRLPVAHVTTQHGRLDRPELVYLYREFEDVPLISISDAQRAPLPHANWIATVQHGIPPDMYRYSPQSDGYFAFLGRISPEKRVDRAIAIAKALERPLRIAAKVDRADVRYFEQEIRPLLDDPLIDFVGEIGEDEKSSFLGGADALLFPIDWPEPFGLVMIESFACGTPVVAFRGGSVSEIIDEGVTGFIVDTLDDAIDAAARVGELDRRDCRQTFDRRFTAEQMTLRYVEVYERLIRGDLEAAESVRVAS
jgi:glycosyltransferase involved in cell wall biosynthesis